jgi:hypothetical protein
MQAAVVCHQVSTAGLREQYDTTLLQTRDVTRSSTGSHRMPPTLRRPHGLSINRNPWAATQVVTVGPKVNTDAVQLVAALGPSYLHRTFALSGFADVLHFAVKGHKSTFFGNTVNS